MPFTVTTHLEVSPQLVGFNCEKLESRKKCGQLKNSKVSVVALIFQ